MKLRVHGFSLVEVVVTIGIFSAVVVAILAFTARSFASFSDLQRRSSSIGRARAALELLSREVREAQSGANGAYPLAATTGAELAFYANVDGAADVERVRYVLTGDVLQRGVIDPVGDPPTYPVVNEVLTTVAEHVVNALEPVFQYFDGTFTGSEAPLTQPVDPTTVRYLTFSIRIDETPGKPPIPVDVVSSATLRNLKDNL